MITDDEISDDEISDVEISDDEISCDEISDDEISDDEISGNRKFISNVLLQFSWCFDDKFLHFQCPKINLECSWPGH